MATPDVVEWIICCYFMVNSIGKFLFADNLLTPSLVKMRKKVFFSDVWAGTYCTFVKQQTTGEIFTFGLNNYKQLGKYNLYFIHRILFNNHK